MENVASELRSGAARLLADPIDNLPKRQIEKELQAGQNVVTTWRIDLSALMLYGYSEAEISAFEKRMYELAEERLNTI